MPSIPHILYPIQMNFQYINIHESLFYHQPMTTQHHIKWNIRFDIYVRLCSGLSYPKSRKIRFHSNENNIRGPCCEYPRAWHAPVEAKHHLQREAEANDTGILRYRQWTSNSSMKRPRLARCPADKVSQGSFSLMLSHQIKHRTSDNPTTQARA